MTFHAKEPVLPYVSKYDQFLARLTKTCPFSPPKVNQTSRNFLAATFSVFETKAQKGNSFLSPPQTTERAFRTSITLSSTKVIQIPSIRTKNYGPPGTSGNCSDRKFNNTMLNVVIPIFKETNHFQLFRSFYYIIPSLFTIISHPVSK